MAYNRRVITNIRKTLNEYPPKFWVLMSATLIDAIGGALLFPFFALYVTFRFEIGMAQMGIIFGIFAISSQVGGLIGGALTDRFGRKGIVIIGLVISALSSIWMGLIVRIEVFYIAAVVVGLLADIGQPARKAMVADLLPEEQRSDGYAVERVVHNFAVVLGPLIGGLIAQRSYLFLFIGDAVTSIIMAMIVYLALPETRPQLKEGEQSGTLQDTFRGYFTVLKDLPFTSFLFIFMLSTLVFVQMESTLSVYMRDVIGLQERHYGYILSMNAAMVVLFQFWIIRRVKEFPALLVMAAGAFFFLLGVGTWSVSSTLAHFALGMAILTIGEMLIVPTSQTIVVRFAPDEMRGRYLATFQLGWTVPFAAGVYLAGLIMDNAANPAWVWYSAALLSAVATFGYILLQKQTQARLAAA